MSARAFAWTMAALAVVAALVLGLRQAGGEETNVSTPQPRVPSAEEVRERLRGAPAPLAALHRRANEILPGSTRTLDRELRRLRGYPVVVNVWAAWCGPCRTELPVFQEVALQRGKEVAFLGVDLRDDRQAAKRLLAKIPQTYPSVEDPRGRIERRYRLLGVPSTAFYDARGRRTFIHQGPYRTEQDLVDDIERYAIGNAAPR